MIFVSATPGVYEKEHQAQVSEQLVRPTGLVDPTLEVRPAGSQVDDCLSEIHAVVEKDERVLITVLTKRMAEDLTDYLMDHGIRVRYLHSDIDTVERVEIIRDLRKGEFDVLGGLIFCERAWICPKCHWSRSWTRIKRASCAQIVP